MEVEVDEVYAAPRTYDRAVELLTDLPPQACILDAACGSGVLMGRLIDMGFDVTGIDVEETARARHGIRFVRGNLEQRLPFDDATFDGVLSVETIEHLWNPFGFLAEARRVLKPHGILVITTPNNVNCLTRLYFGLLGQFPAFRQAAYEKIHHVNPIHPVSLMRWFNEHGFEEAVTTTNGFWIPYTKFRPRTKSLLWGQCAIFRARKSASNSTNGDIV